MGTIETTNASDNDESHANIRYSLVGRTDDSFRWGNTIQWTVIFIVQKKILSTYNNVISYDMACPKVLDKLLYSLYN